ncbi:MAG: cysteine--tRNA ligase [Dehalococcoidia bacterium]
MLPIQLYNTLHRRVEPFEPSAPPLVRMYTCGPTVYRPVHIGNLRSYLMADWIRRTLMRAGFEVRQVVNITDVGHMRQEQLDRGEDKLVAEALATGKTPAEIADFFTALYRRDLERLRILPPSVSPKATEHIAEMIALIERLLAGKHAYLAEGNVYFDVASFAAYGELSGNTHGEDLAEAVRVQADPLKRAPHDFALWKAAEPGRSLQWASPWGQGFPGWHIECSAMAFKHLGEQLDLHTGGVDNIFPHHEDERAQSEAATGRRFAGHWVHGQHLLVDGLKMAKSTGNAYTLEDLEGRGFDPLDFRYLCLTAHFRHRLNFTFQALRAAHQALSNLRGRVRLTAPVADDAWSEPWLAAFDAAIANDLNLPDALGFLWKMLHAPGDEAAKVAALLDADAVLGLGLAEAAREEPPAIVQTLLHERGDARERAAYARADRLREAIQAQGYRVLDARRCSNALLAAQSPVEQGVTRSEEIASLLHEPDRTEVTIGLVVTNAEDDLKRCVSSIVSSCSSHPFELLVIDNGSTDGTRAWLADASATEPRLRVVRTDHSLGEGAGRNAVLKQSLGRIVALVDTSIEFAGDPLDQLVRALDDPGVGAVGGFGLTGNSLHCFDPAGGGEVDALEGYLFALRRSTVVAVGLMDEKYRFYRNLDLDFSFQIRERGLRLVALPDLPLIVHPHRVWNSLNDEQREALSKKNFNRFLHRWRDRAMQRLAAAGAGG